MTSLSIYYHEKCGSAVDPLICIQHVDLLLFLRGKHIGPMDPRPAYDGQGAQRDKGERKLPFRGEECSDNTVK
jgi:hypothetical protein